MPSFIPSSPKRQAKESKESKESKENSAPKSPMRRLSGKLAKKVKQQLWRLDEALHHVTHTQHDPNAAPAPRARTRTQSFPSSHFLRAFVPSSPRSSRSRETWNEKYAQDRSFSDRESCSSDDHQLVVPTAAVVSPFVSVDFLPEVCSPVAEPAPIHDDDELMRSATMSSGLSIIEAEPSDKEGATASVSEELQDRGCSAAESSAHNTPLELTPPTLAERAPSLHQQPLLDIHEDEIPSPSEESDHEDAEVPHTVAYVPAQVVPTTFFPIPNMRHPFSANMLTWWLCRNSVYNTCMKFKFH